MIRRISVTRAAIGKNGKRFRDSGSRFGGKEMVKRRIFACFLLV